MKRVRKEDLECLIKDFYYDYIRRHKLEENEKNTYFGLDINSLYIRVRVIGEFDVEEDAKAFIENFTKAIQEVTFENLKVTYNECHSISPNGSIYNITMYIANAYEVIR